MTQRSILLSTGQQWKLAISGSCTIVGGFLLIGGLFLSGRQPREITTILVLLGMTVVAFGAIFACISVRCPNCGTPWIWLALKKQGAGSWLVWLTRQQVCPSCKYGSVRNSEERL